MYVPPSWHVLRSWPNVMKSICGTTLSRSTTLGWSYTGVRIIKEVANGFNRLRFMEKTVRILDQSALSTRKYTDKKTGQEKVMNAVTFKLTDGIDTFLGEVTGERAVNCPMYDKNYFYRVQCSMVVRDWLSQQTGEQMQATTIYIDKISMA